MGKYQRMCASSQYQYNVNILSESLSDINIKSYIKTQSYIPVLYVYMFCLAALHNKPHGSQSACIYT